MDNYTPATVAPLFNAARARRSAEAFAARKRNCRKIGYAGPLTRTELAARTTA